jgi:hypothetical protein
VVLKSSAFGAADAAMGGDHWCDLVGCGRVCECGATCEEHMEDAVVCGFFKTLESTGVRVLNGTEGVRVAGKSVAPGLAVKERAANLLTATVLAGLALWLPRWFLPAVAVLACAVWSAFSLWDLIHSTREWFRIRNHVRRRQVERLVDDVHRL